MELDIIRYDENMLTLNKRMTRGIHEGASSTFNRELEEFATSHNIPVPQGYYPALLHKLYLENDFAKFRKIYPSCPELDAWSRAKSAFFKIYAPTMVGGTLSFDEAISQIELSASPGFPFNKKYKTKREVIADPAMLTLLKGVIESVFENGSFEYEFMGEKYEHCFWQTSPKSEIRVIDKYNNPDINKRKTRTFMCADIIVHIVAYMLYKKQNDNLLSLGLTNSWSAMGANPWYGGWDRLARVLSRNGSNDFDCWDASHMEASLGDMMQDAIYEVRHSVIPGEQVAKDWFFAQISCSKVIDPEGWLVLKFGKNPSGSFNTLSDNTFALILIYLYTLAKKHEDIESLIDAASNLALKCMGDDSIVERNEQILDFKECAAELGFVMELEAPPGPLTQCSFLNAKFVYLEQHQKWVQRGNYEKVMANVYLNFKKRSWRFTYVKLCAARKLFWAFEQERNHIDQLINYVHANHLEDMRSERQHDDVLSFNACISQLMSDAENRFLVFGDE